MAKATLHFISHRFCENREASVAAKHDNKLLSTKEIFDEVLSKCAGRNEEELAA